jgi:hypothetical protein
MIYVYAITESPVAAEAIEVGPLAAVVREVDEAPANEPEALLAHEAVVEGVMAAQPVLPVRFGTLFGSAAEVVSLLESKATEFSALLQRVRGCVELSVRMRWTPQAPDSGAAWLQERRRADEAHAPLAELARSSTTRSQPGLLAAAYLVPAADVAPFTDHLTTIRDAHPELDFSCTGPWPPYSFV